MTADAEEPSAGAGTGAEAPTATAFRTLAGIELDFSEDGTPPLRRSSAARCSSPPALAKARRTRASSKPMENMTGRAASRDEDKEGDSSRCSCPVPLIRISMASCSLPPVRSSARCTSASSNPMQNITGRASTRAGTWAAAVAACAAADLAAAVGDAGASSAAAGGLHSVERDDRSAGSAAVDAEVDLTQTRERLRSGLYPMLARHSSSLSIRF